MHHIGAQAMTVAQATNFFVETWATVMPCYPVMARQPSDELVLTSRSHATLWQYISIKYTTTKI
jgi:hypothetical protein